MSGVSERAELVDHCSDYVWLLFIHLLRFFPDFGLEEYTRWIRVVIYSKNLFLFIRPGYPTIHTWISQY